MTRATRIYGVTAGALAALIAVSCTMKKQEAPPLTGPSEYGTSIAVEVRPDILTQDGVSPATITVTARNAGGVPVGGLQLRVGTLVDGVLVDFGTLSTKTVVTGSDGRATLTYTAPPAAPGGVDAGTVVQIAVTPVGTDFGNAVARTASVRLVPQGVVLPPIGLVAAFTVTPTNPTEGQPVAFDASGSQPQNEIASYTWTFGDGGTASGPTVTHTYDDAGSYFATLTITDAYGRSVSRTQSVTIGGGTRPRAVFTYSPQSPVGVGMTVTFDASASKPTLNSNITSYEWTFGDNAAVHTSTGPRIDHAYSAAGDFTVTLRVRDTLGGVATTTRTISVR